MIEQTIYMPASIVTTTTAAPPPPVGTAVAVEQPDGTTFIVSPNLAWMYLGQSEAQTGMSDDTLAQVFMAFIEAQATSGQPRDPDLLLGLVLAQAFGGHHDLAALLLEELLRLEPVGSTVLLLHASDPSLENRLSVLKLEILLSARGNAVSPETVLLLAATRVMLGEYQSALSALRVVEELGGMTAGAARLREMARIAQ